MWIVYFQDFMGEVEIEKVCASEKEAKEFVEYLEAYGCYSPDDEYYYYEYVED